MAPNQPQTRSGFDVSVGSFSTELGCPRHVRFTPVSDHRADIAGGWPLHRCRRNAGGFFHETDICSNSELLFRLHQGWKWVADLGDMHGEYSSLMMVLRGLRRR